MLCKCGSELVWDGIAYMWLCPNLECFIDHSDKGFWEVPEQPEEEN